MRPTPSQTVGPFYGYALPFPGGGELAEGGLVVHGQVWDGAGQPVPDALLEVWQAGPDGGLSGAPGSLRHDTGTGQIAGRHGLVFTGFGRVSTDADGHWMIRTVMPGSRAYLSVCVFARGLGHHLFTRIYLRDDPGDPLLGRLPPARRSTLLAAGESVGVYRFDVRLQGEGETVFLDFG
ncbi:protocatechuate 3,4-dioxygenase subunit alpha [Nonomuraea typhae]|uniref:protocatechuate 3,4-dioxygenase subunit alpha n=1 Tax=Nonomuraea typhae TaxID=2603600 RepID=UPI0012FA961B|nr:protocatechuate 3,4-dioxygenase subunit alpha [Nonomuraea typhae]